jgi:aspartate/methionine/tyrosine aminotransferase
MNPPIETPSGFRPVPRTGVIFVMTEAARFGYDPTDERWANLGQGAPEVGEIPDAPERIQSIPMEEIDHEYAPVDGLPELREAVAKMYNERYRRGKASQYTGENVAICAGGRLALTRAVSTLGRTHLGHFLPDYTAYEELLDAFGTFVPIPILLNPDNGYAFSREDLEREIYGRGLSALLLSNPCNPTGKLIEGEELSRWVETGRNTDCTLIFDEFYSHYTYNTKSLTTSAAEYIEDVDRDPVILLDGLTKNWRYPGWRVCWTVAPKPIIESIASAGSFLDGGCSRPMQRAALQLVNRTHADTEARALQKHFGEKRSRMIKGLQELGIEAAYPPEGGFYVWGDLSKLRPTINTGMAFFQEALQHNVIVVPGSFFDINPGQRRADRPSRFRHHVRFSFGPNIQTLERGLDHLSKMIR